MADKDDSGVKNLNAALSGDHALAGATKDQITAMGGEVDDELDTFKSTPADRGDIVDAPPPAKDDDKADDEPPPAKDDDKADDEPPPAKDDDKDDDEPPPAKDDDKADDEGKKPAKKGDEPRIPKSRFDEVNARRKAAEDELAQLKAQGKAKEEGAKFDFKKAEREYLELALDGKIDSAMAKRDEIDAAKEAEWETKQAAKADSSVSAREVQKELSQLVKKYESEFDAFDPEHENFSEDIADEVQSMFVGYLQNRRDLTHGEAFKLAIDNTVKIYGLEKRGSEPPAKEEPKPNVRLKDKKDTKKKIEAAKAAPPDLGKAGVGGADKGSSKIDVENITDEEFNAMPESTKARLRGDIL